MECKELVAWVPFTPQKLCLKESKCNHSNFIPINGDLCHGKVQKLGFSNGVDVNFGVEPGKAL